MNRNNLTEYLSDNHTYFYIIYIISLNNIILYMINQYNNCNNNIIHDKNNELLNKLLQLFLSNKI
jgi:hypothetical protein